MSLKFVHVFALNQATAVKVEIGLWEHEQLSAMDPMERVPAKCTWLPFKRLARGKR